MQHSEEHDNHWLLVDKVNNVVITFEEHNFNDKQKVTILNDSLTSDATELARILREMGDFAVKHYSHIIF